MSRLRLGLFVLLSAMALAPEACTYGTRPEAVPGTVYQLLGEKFTVETVAQGLSVPWALAWLPDGRLLVTERAGRIMVIEPGSAKPRLLAEVPDVDAAGEHGLMSIALSPRFAADHFMFLSYTGRDAGGKLQNVIARFRLDGDKLADRKVLVEGLPAADYHDGLPLKFGPDGKLYAATGDAEQGPLAQRMDSLAGKFLRMRDDGSISGSNPFPGSPIWTLGHRNCQGFDWDPRTGLLWATEHGPTFPVDGAGGDDELNLIEAGHNYGWPTYHGDTSGPGCTAPVVQWGRDTIAPAGACFYTGRRFAAWRNCLFFACLRGECIMCVQLAPDDYRQVERTTKVLFRQFGRLRAMAQGPDGYLYFTTSNTDSRGKPLPVDDRVLRIVPFKGR